MTDTLLIGKDWEHKMWSVLLLRLMKPILIDEKTSLFLFYPIRWKWNLVNEQWNFQYKKKWLDLNKYEHDENQFYIKKDFISDEGYKMMSNDNFLWQLFVWKEKLY